MKTDNEGKTDWTDRLQERWNNLSMLQQRIATLAAIALLETCLVYCCWVTETQGQNTPIIHIGGFRVMSATGILICALLNAPMLVFIQDKVSTRMKAIGRRLKTPALRTANRITQHIPPLTQAHGFYTVGRDAEARTLTEQVLAQEPENVTAQELLQLIDARQAHSKVEPEEKPDSLDRLLNSKYAEGMVVILAVIIAVLSLIQCIHYICIGVTQGWNTTELRGPNKYGQMQYSRAWFSALVFSLVPTVVLVCFLVHYFPRQMGTFAETLLDRGVNLCLAISKWGKSRLSAIRNFVSRMARSTPSRSSEPKASPASRLSSTTRTRRRK